MKQIILASGSPRRRELLAQTGLAFEVIPGEVDEDAVVEVLRDEWNAKNQADGGLADCDMPKNSSTGNGDVPGNALTVGCVRGNTWPEAVVQALSASKAEAVAEQIPEGIVIGSDTIVWDNEIMGKPIDRADAYRMLRQLQGRTHSVFTGVTVLVKDAAGCRKQVFSCETKVEVYPMTEQETEAYLDTGEAMDKAGAYGIQGKFGLWVKGIEGDYNCVVGLPLSALWQVLKNYI